MSKHRQEFLISFINQFFEKSKTKRRSSRNTINVIRFQINKVSRKKFDKKINFSDDEILDAFRLCSFQIMDNFGRERDWEKWKIGTEMPETYFVNIQHAQLGRLISANRKITPETNMKPETVLEVNNLKAGLEEFWESKKHLLT